MTTISRILFLLSVLFYSSKAFAMHLVSKEAHINMHTAKVATIEGEINMFTVATFIREMDETQAERGRRVILIDSPGGELDAGEIMAARIEVERLQGKKVVCVVEHFAASMAFNLLSHCDIRLAMPGSEFMFHSAAYGGLGGPGIRLTPKVLRQLAKELQEADEASRRRNAKALHMSLGEYDDYRDREVTWTAEELLARGYLKGFAKLKK